MIDVTKNFRLPLAAAIALTLGACASSAGLSPEVARLQDELARVRADQRVAVHADTELVQAERAVGYLVAEGNRLDEDDFDQRVYLADRLIQIAEAEGLAGYAEERTQTLASERDKLILEARTREAETARAEADVARLAAERERMNATLAREDALAAQRQLETLRVALVELKAEETERGLVVTLGDVLFETDRAELKPGAARNLDQLAQALRDNPTSTVEIEGHTDSTGGHGYNQTLSDRRAQAVRGYLVSHGIDGSRVASRGLGPDYPVASNGTEAGRQQNRRVEVIIRNDAPAVASDELFDDED